MRRRCGFGLPDRPEPDTPPRSIAQAMLLGPSRSAHPTGASYAYLNHLTSSVPMGSFWMNSSKALPS